MALAGAPRTSPRPAQRPGAAVAVSHQVSADPALKALAPRRAPRPAHRPSQGGGYGTPVQVASFQLPAATTRGRAVCGRSDIIGQTLAAIPAELPGCGVKNPVQITSVSGVALTQPAVMDCDTAKALDNWVAKGVVPAVGRLGGGVAALNVIAHYSCRSQNNQPGAKISEHGKGHAVDVAGVTLKNGVVIDVLKGWNDRIQGKILQEMHASACKIFSTVLGPGSDGYHENHIHVDTANTRGNYCR